MHSKHEGFDSVKAKIIATASELFTRTGVHGTSLNDIAAAADIAKGTVYYYYPAKDTLVADVARAHCGYITNALLSWAEEVSRGDEPMDRMLILIQALLSDDTQRSLHAVLLCEGSPDNPALAASMASALEKWTVLFEVGALKLRLPEARRLRSRTDLFFTLLGGYMLKPAVSQQDMREFTALMVN